MNLLREADTHPFAAVRNGEATRLPDEAFALDDANNRTAPAYDYRLTNNSTTFTIDAPAPGLAVLTEAYVAGDFRVRVNGEPVKYFRVNHAFRGVNIPAAGKYVISYSYWPKHFTASLVMAGVGALLLGLWMTVTLRNPRAETVSSEGRMQP